ncbi:MAG: hypothetical protein V3T41_08645 [bacterium]
MFAKRIGVAAWAATAALIVTVPLTADAVRYNGYLGTTVYGYSTVEDPAETIADTYVPLRFRVDQDTGGGNIGIVASTRMYKDVGGEGDVNGRVYYGYFRWRPPVKGLEFNLGRQYIAAGVTAATLDGARVVFKRGKKWRADVYGGSTVAPDYGPMRRFSQLEEKDKANAPYDRGYWQDYYTYGAHGGTNVKELWSGMVFPVWVGVGGAISKKDGHLSDTTFGLEAAEDLLTNLKATQEIHYDFIGRHVDYQYYAARYRPWKPLRTYVDYRWQEPRIDYTSIFSVFARDGRHRWRVGGQYEVAKKLQPFVDYSLAIRGDHLGHLAQAGLVQNYEYVYLRYGGLYGVGNRVESGGEEVGGFAAAEFPKPIPAFERLSAGISGNYIRYKGYGTPAPKWEDAPDVALIDLHGRLKVWRTFETTLGMEALRNLDRDYEIRAYLQASVSISR